MMKTILTYGTFDLFHVGHLNLLERLKNLGGTLIVGVSTDAFNELKGKKTIIKYEDRARIVSSLRCVDHIIKEESWEQKEADIARYHVDILGMGDDWRGKFDNLSSLCEIKYLPRTVGISSTELKNQLRILSDSNITDIKEALDTISAIIRLLK